MNKKGFLPLPSLALILILLKKAGGVLLTSLGAFFVFTKYQEVGLSMPLFTTVLFSLLLIIIGQFLFWFIYNEDLNFYRRENGLWEIYEN